MDETEAILANIRSHPGTSAQEISQATNIPKRTIFRLLKDLVAQKQISRFGQKPHITYAVGGVTVVGKSKASDPPLFSFQITNPITYLKRWWGRVMANEGVDFHLKIRPLTAIAMVAVISSGSFVLAKITLPEPVVRYIPQLAPSPSPNPWREAAYTGKLLQSGKRYYLATADSEAITLEAPANVNLPKLLNRRILAVGKYNTITKVLQVESTEDLEILPTQAVPVPIYPVPNGTGATIPSPSPVQNTQEKSPSL